jgi:glycosyltransferase involved in cell wall biosynthesis
MKIALVHDYLVQYGGAERVLECFAELFPYAPIYTLIYDKDAMHGVFKNRKIYTSYLQKLPFAKSWHRLLPPLMPSAIEQFNFDQYDIVLSDSSSYAKGIITSPRTIHVCYMHTPMRYAWDDCQKYTEDFGFPRFVKKLVPLAMNYIRLWDRVSADRIDKLVCNSNFVARRIKKYYQKEALVINPPVNVGNFQVSKSQGKYFLMVGRLIAYKRHDIAIEAFNKLGLKLKIIGRGPEMKRLQKMAKGNIEFLGRVSEKELPKYYSECQAFIFPQEEDFGIVAIEAMASGRPLIAFQGGDIPEHMEEEKMGIFFDEQKAESIVEAVEKFQGKSFDPEYIRSKAMRFDKEIFKARIKEYIDEIALEQREGFRN